MTQHANEALIVSELIHSKRLDELTEQYRWKAENNIRFYDKLGMTTKEKEDFLAKEFATVHWLTEMRIR